MANENCLLGMKCPKCGSEGPYGIAVKAWCPDVTDDGTDGLGDIEWDDKSICVCKACDFNGVVADFYEENTPPSGADLVKEIMTWTTVKDENVRIIWKCPECGTEYAVGPSEATIPYCSNDCCRNCGEETEYERTEVRDENG